MKYDNDELYILVDFLEEVWEEGAWQDAHDDYLNNLDRIKEIIKSLIKE